MADEKYFRRMIANELGLKVSEVTPDVVHNMINRLEREATHSIFETTRPVGVCTPIAQRVYLGLVKLMPYKEELKLTNYIHNWNK